MSQSAICAHLQNSLLTFNSMCPADDITRDGLNEVQLDVTENLVSALSKINRTQEQTNEISKRFLDHQKGNNQTQQQSGISYEKKNNPPRNQHNGGWRPRGPRPQKFWGYPPQGFFPNPWHHYQMPNAAQFNPRMQTYPGNDAAAQQSQSLNQNPPPPPI